MKVVFTIGLYVLLIFFICNSKLYEVEQKGVTFSNFSVGNLVKTKYVPVFDKKKMAVLVPYRNSFKELVQFVPLMHMFLVSQMIPFHIFVVHQTDILRFNRGALINVGYIYVRDNFDYAVHQDVDLVPLNSNLSYEYPIDAVFHVADTFYHPTISEKIVSFVFYTLSKGLWNLSTWRLQLQNIKVLCEDFNKPCL